PYVISISIDPVTGKAKDPSAKKILEPEQDVTIDGEKKTIKAIPNHPIFVSADGTRLLVSVGLESGNYKTILFNRKPGTSEIISGTQLFNPSLGEGIEYGLSADGSQAVAVTYNNTLTQIAVAGTTRDPQSGLLNPGSKVYLRKGDTFKGMKIDDIDIGMHDISDDGLTVGLRAQVDGEWSTILLHLNEETRELEDISVLLTEGQTIKQPNHQQTKIEGSPTLSPELDEVLVLGSVDNTPQITRIRAKEVGEKSDAEVKEIEILGADLMGEMPKDTKTVSLRGNIKITNDKRYAFALVGKKIPDPSAPSASKKTIQVPQLVRYDYKPGGLESPTVVLEGEQVKDCKGFEIVSPDGSLILTFFDDGSPKLNFDKNRTGQYEQSDLFDGIAEFRKYEYAGDWSLFSNGDTEIFIRKREGRKVTIFSHRIGRNTGKAVKLPPNPILSKHQGFPHTGVFKQVSSQDVSSSDNGTKLLASVITKADNRGKVIVFTRGEGSVPTDGQVLLIAKEEITISGHSLKLDDFGNNARAISKNGEQVVIVFQSGEDSYLVGSRWDKKREAFGDLVMLLEPADLKIEGKIAMAKPVLTHDGNRVTVTIAQREKKNKEGIAIVDIDPSTGKRKGEPVFTLRSSQDKVKGLDKEVNLNANHDNGSVFSPDGNQLFRVVNVKDNPKQIVTVNLPGEEKAKKEKGEFLTLLDRAEEVSQLISLLLQVIAQIKTFVLSGKGSAQTLADGILVWVDELAQASERVGSEGVRSRRPDLTPSDSTTLIGQLIDQFLKVFPHFAPHLFVLRVTLLRIHAVLFTEAGPVDWSQGRAILHDAQNKGIPKDGENILSDDDRLIGQQWAILGAPIPSPDGTEVFMMTELSIKVGESGGVETRKEKAYVSVARNPRTGHFGKARLVDIDREAISREIKIDNWEFKLEPLVSPRDNDLIVVVGESNDDDWKGRIVRLTWDQKQRTYQPSGFINKTDQVDAKWAGLSSAGTNLAIVGYRADKPTKISLFTYDLTQPSSVQIQGVKRLEAGEVITGLDEQGVMAGFGEPRFSADDKWIILSTVAGDEEKPGYLLLPTNPSEEARCHFFPTGED
ncbi:hypothetical protein BVX98_07590, partial [bacterium F11]